LFFNLPRGYVRRSSGDIALDPDEQVQATIRLVFDVFEHCRTINGVLAYCVTHGIDLPQRARSGPAKGQCHQVSRHRSFGCARLNEVAAVVYISYEHGL
jgi:hypothetical protein